MSGSLATILADQQANQAALVAAVSANNAQLTTMAADLTAALAAAQNAGATPAQLSELQAVSDAMKKAVADLSAADAANAPPAPPPPVVTPPPVVSTPPVTPPLSPQPVTSPTP